MSKTENGFSKEKKKLKQPSPTLKTRTVLAPHDSSLSIHSPSPSSLLG